MPSIAETATELIQWVFPEHAGAPGQIHGGRMMQWIAQAGTMAAARVAHGTVVLGAMDDIDFLHPVKVGQIAILSAQVEYVGTSSLEVGVRVWGEDVATGERTVTLNSHLVFVSVDEDAKPRPVGAGSSRGTPPRPRWSRRRAAGASSGWRASPIGPAGLRDVDTDSDEELSWRFESARSVLPEDALFGNMMFPGKMLMELDEAGGILSMRYCRGFVMTACLDAMDFYTPIWSARGGDVQGRAEPRRHLVAGGRRQGARREAVDRRGPSRLHGLSHVRAPGPGPAPPAVPAASRPGTAAERRRWQAALARRERRLERVKRLKATLADTT